MVPLERICSDTTGLKSGLQLMAIWRHDSSFLSLFVDHPFRQKPVFTKDLLQYEFFFHW